MQLKDILTQGKELSIQQKERQRQVKLLNTELENVTKEYIEGDTLLKDLKRACILITSVSDDTVNSVLNDIKQVINRALSVIFKDSPRSIDIVPVMYKERYPHFLVKLYNENDIERTFKQSGAGLAQVISFLATVCMIDVKGCRKILVMDEILNGLHPSAKDLVYVIMASLTDRFQFICIEYGLDIGKQYEVINKRNSKGISTSNLKVLEESNYYKSLI